MEVLDATDEELNCKLLIHAERRINRLSSQSIAMGQGVSIANTMAGGDGVCGYILIRSVVM